MITQHAALVLASGSTIRQQMLKAVGLNFSVVPSGVEESLVKAEFSDAPIPELALALARAKTLAVSKTHPDAYTIGADQLCVHHGKILSKPGSYERAEAQLAALAGDIHEQHSGVVLAKGSEILWQYHAKATLTVRPLSASAIHHYIAADAPLSSCGAYKFEAMGRHLFSAVDGDQDVIQGLPLVPLLAALEQLGAYSIA
jgi:septum formation protein